MEGRTSKSAEARKPPVYSTSSSTSLGVLLPKGLSVSLSRESPPSPRASWPSAPVDEGPGNNVVDFAGLRVSSFGGIPNRSVKREIGKWRRGGWIVVGRTRRPGHATRQVRQVSQHEVKVARERSIAPARSTHPSRQRHG